MKSIITLLAVLFSHAAFCQQSGVPVVSLAGIGAVKLGMKKEALDKMLPAPLKLRNVLREEWSQDTVAFSLNGTDFQVILSKSVEEKDKGAVIVYGIYCRNPQVKTPSGIGIGDDKLNIISTYEDYMLHVAPGYDSNSGTKIKGQSSVTLYGDEQPTMIIFYLEENKVTGFWVQYAEGC